MKLDSRLTLVADPKVSVSQTRLELLLTICDTNTEVAKSVLEIQDVKFTGGLKWDDNEQEIRYVREPFS